MPKDHCMIEVQVIKAVFLVLNLLVQVGLLLLLVSLVKKNARVARASQHSAMSNEQLIELNRQQLSVADEQMRLNQQIVLTQYRPILAAFLFRDPDIQGDNLVFIVQNTGKGIADNISIEFPTEASSNEKLPWQDLIELAPTIGSLGPGYQFRCPFERAGRYVDNDEDEELEGPHKFAITLAYTDAATELEYRDVLNLDLSRPTGICKQ